MYGDTKRINLENKLYDHEGNTILYDMKDEFSDLLKFNTSDSNLEKWKKYKSYKVDENSVYGIDCDVCCFAVSIYNEAFEFLKICKSPTKQYKKISTKDLVSCCIAKKEGGLVEIIPLKNIFATDICYTREYKYQLILNTSNSKEYYRGDVMTSFTNTFNHYNKNFKENKNIEDEIEKLAKLYHTIGNMIPVPTGFNIGRAGSYAKFDYWDLTMMKIKEWYDDKTNDKPLNELLHNDLDSIMYCKKWLKHFDIWKDFVEKNHLEVFTESCEEEVYKPLPFWAEHSYESHDLPSDEKEFLKYLQLLNNLIIKRNSNIINLIEKQNPCRP